MGRVPLGVKLVAAAFVAVLVPAYWGEYGPGNFLWFSNVALVLLAAGLAAESPLLVSAAAVGVLLPEVGWSADLLAGLARGLFADGPGRWRGPFGVAGYLWDSSRPAWVRGLTLYHLALPPGLWWATGRLGYDRRGLGAWSLLAAGVAGLALAATDPAANVDRLHGFGRSPQASLPRWAFLLAWAAVMWGGFWVPTHLLLRWGRPAAGAGGAGKRARMRTAASREIGVK